MNPRNNANVTGRLAGDPKVFTNADGSRKVAFTVFADHDYVTKSTGERGSDKVPVEAFIRKEVEGLGVYDFIHQGDLVRVDFKLAEEAYPSKKTGEMVYTLKASVEDITLLENKSVTQARLAKRVAEQTSVAQAAQPVQTAQPAVAEELPVV